MVQFHNLSPLYLMLDTELDKCRRESTRRKLLLKDFQHKITDYLAELEDLVSANVTTNLEEIVGEELWENIQTETGFYNGN